MNWSALAAWGGVVGGVGSLIAAVAVVVTLFYLAAQVKSAVRQNQRDAIQHAWDSLNACCDRLSESVEVASIVNRGRADRDSLDENEWLVFYFIHIRLLNTLESWHLLLEDVEDREFVDQQHENIFALVRFLIDYPSTRKIYAEVRGHFAPGIRSLIDNALSESQDDSRVSNEND